MNEMRGAVQCRTTAHRTSRFEAALEAIARWSVQHRRAVGAAALALLVLAAVAAAGTIPRLQLARFEVPGSPSVLAADHLESRGTGTPNLTLLLRPAQGQALDDPQVRDSADQVARRLEQTPGVEGVFSYWSTGHWGAMSSREGDSALMMARLVGDPTTTRTLLDDLSPAISGRHGAVHVEVGGSEEVFRQVADQARADFLIAEAIILPGVLVLLLIVLRRPAAALATLGLGIASVLGSMALIGVIASLTEVSTFAANLILVMGIALGVDYGLFVIARHREAREGGLDPEGAAIQAVRGAGHTVIVSAAAVAAALAALLLLPFPFLRSLAYAGICVVAVATVLAVVVLPALLAMLGARVDGRGPGTGRDDGLFARGARAAMRRPVACLLAGLAVTAVMALPVLRMEVGPPDDRILPPHTSSRQVAQAIREGYPVDVDDMIAISMTAPADQGPPQEVRGHGEALSRVPGVSEVVDPRERGLPIDAPLVLIPTEEALEADPYALVERVRAVPGPQGAVVGGYPAELADYRQALIERLPLALGALLLLSTLVLVAATRSIVLPIKAALLNTASLSVLGGALVWVFQEGHLAWLLGVSTTGTLDLSIPILMVCMAFGLSMDYEVLLVLRILEEHRRGAGLEDAVAVGVQRSAPLVTSAAGILSASFLVYLTSSIAYLTMLAVGMALVILLDATLIRLVLLPAAMRLMGRANWWWPIPPRGGRRRGRPAAADH